MTTIGNQQLSPAIFTAFVKRIKMLFPELERVQFVNIKTGKVGKVASSAKLEGSILVAIVALYNEMMTGQSEMAIVAAQDWDRIRRQGAYNNAKIRNQVNRLKFGR